MFIFNTLEHLKDQGFHTLITSCANVLVQSGVNPKLIDIVYDDIESDEKGKSTYAAIMTRKTETPEMDPITGDVNVPLQFTIYKTPGDVIRVCINSLSEYNPIKIPTVDYIAKFNDPKYDGKPMFEVAPIESPTKPQDQMKFAWFVGMLTGALSRMLCLPAPQNPNNGGSTK